MNQSEDAPSQPPYSVWDLRDGREVPAPGATCPDWDDPVRLEPRPECCGQPAIGRCARCGRYVYKLHAKHQGPHKVHPSRSSPAERGLPGPMFLGALPEPPEADTEYEDAVIRMLEELVRKRSLSSDQS